MIRYYFICVAFTIFLFAGSGCDKANIQSVPADSIISLQAISDISNLYADGKTIIQFKATIPKTFSSDTRDIVFTLSDASFGKFTGISANNSQTIKSNSDGIALSSVKLGTTPGDYFVSAQVTAGGVAYKSTEIRITLKPLSNADKIQLSADNLQPVADGFSIVNFTVNSTFSQDKKVVFTSNLGTFLGSPDPKTINITLDDQGKAVVPYRITNEITPNIILAKLTDGSFATIILNPAISYPDTILADLSATKVDTAGGFIQITSFLRKFNSNLKVSKNTQVYFTAYQVISSNKVTVGRFTGINSAVSDNEGNIPAVKFFADSGGINISLPVFIEISAYNSPTDKVKLVLPVTIKL